MMLAPAFYLLLTLQAPAGPHLSPEMKRTLQDRDRQRIETLINHPEALPIHVAGDYAFTVLDSRPDVLSGDRNDTFAGLSRSLYGIPYPSDAKRPLAVEIGMALSKALTLGGSKPRSTTSSPFAGRAGALKTLKIYWNLDRYIVIEIRDWWTDHLVHTDFHHDVSLIVFDAMGRELGSSASTGHDSIGRGQRPERADLDAAFNDIIQTLFGAPEIKAALAAGAVPVTPAGKVCSVDQILKMKEAGLAQPQIEAACGGPK
jgi:hypothetical protein